MKGWKRRKERWEANEIRGRYRRRDFLFLTSGSLKICVYLARRWDVSFDRWETSWLGIFFFLLQVCEIGLVSKGFFPFSIFIYFFFYFNVGRLFARDFFFSFLFTVDHSFTEKKWKIINFSSGADRAKRWIAKGRIVVAWIESKIDGIFGDRRYSEASCWRSDRELARTIDPYFHDSC